MGRMTGHTDADVDRTGGPTGSDTCHHCKGDTWHLGHMKHMTM
jgi:hypothetical protein